MMTWETGLLLVGAGTLCGIINVLAGSGSLITLPALIFIGLPAPVANGTNRIAILMQNITAVTNFHRQNVLQLPGDLRWTASAIAGALVGAWIAVDLDERAMEIAIGAVMVIMLGFIVFKPDAWLRASQERHIKPGAASAVIMFVIGIYGGFIQAGVGLFLLAGLALSAGMDLVRANAVKLLIVLLYTPFALGVFIYNDQVDFSAGITLGIGNVLGAFVASRIAVSWGPRFLRWVLIVVVAFSALKLLGAVDWLLALL